MNSLSDSIILPLLYRCTPVTFLSRKTRSKAHSLRRWPRVGSLNTCLNHYKSLTSLQVVGGECLEGSVFLRQIADIEPILVNLLSLYLDVESQISELHQLELSRRCPNLTSLKCPDLGWCDSISSIPPSVTRLKLAYPASVNRRSGLYGVELMRGLPCITECNVPTDEILPNMIRMSYIAEGHDTITSPVLEQLCLIAPLNKECEPVFNCPSLTSLDLNITVTNQVMSAILSCKQLTRLTISTYIASPSMLKELDCLLYLKIGRCCNYRAIAFHSEELPQSLEYLDIMGCSGQLIMRSEESLPRLLVLKCSYVQDHLPKNLKKLNARDRSGLDLGRTSLTSLTINTTSADKLVLPESLTTLKVLGPCRNLPEKLPARVRKLTALHASIPPSWALSNLQYIRYDSILTVKQRRELRPGLE